MQKDARVPCTAVPSLVAPQSRVLFTRPKILPPPFFPAKRCIGTCSTTQKPISSMVYHKALCVVHTKEKRLRPQDDCGSTLTCNCKYGVRASETSAVGEGVNSKGAMCQSPSPLCLPAWSVGAVGTAQEKEEETRNGRMHEMGNRGWSPPTRESRVRGRKGNQKRWWRLKATMLRSERRADSKEREREREYGDNEGAGSVAAARYRPRHFLRKASIRRRCIAHGSRSPSLAYCGALAMRFGSPCPLFGLCQEQQKRSKRHLLRKGGGEYQGG